MAQNTLEIIIKANAGKAIATIKTLDKTIGGFGTTSAKGFTALKQQFAALDAKLASPAGMKSLIGTAGLVAGALSAVGITVKKLADDFMNYAFQVKDFGRIIGATPEEASKLIQVADDVRLSVESMTTAMRAAINKGYAPTIAELGRMSDAYLAIQDPIERSRWLIETFGRSGLEMAKLMELGSVKIEAMGKSVEGTARLMTAEGIKAAEDYYAALDNLGEVGEDLTLIFGSKLAPALASIGSGFADVAASALGADNVLTNIIGSLLSQKTTVEQVAVVLGLYMTGNLNGAQASEILRGSVEAVTQDMNELIKASGAAAGAVDDLGQSTDELVSALDLGKEALSGSGISADLMEQALDQLNLKMGKTTEEEIKLREGMEQLTSLMDAKLITPAQWADMMMLLAENSGDAAAQVRILNEYMNRLKDKTITLTVNTNLPPGWTMGGPGAGGATQILPPNDMPRRSPPRTRPGARGGVGGATGLDMIIPPGFTGDSFPLWASSGERVKIETPAQQKAGQVVNIVNNYNISVQEALNVRDLARQVTREQQRAGVT